MLGYIPVWLVIALIYGRVKHSQKLDDFLTVGPIAPVVGIWLFYRLYENAITRCAYIGLLVYWFVYLSGGGLVAFDLYTALLQELLRFSWSDRGERDAMGHHWTMNVAERLSMTVINKILEPFAETHFWKMAIFNIFMTLFVFGHYVFQLWVQRVIATLRRWNRNAWRWRELIIEYSIRAVLRRLDSQFSRSLLNFWWSSWYWLYKVLDNNRTSKMLVQLPVVRILLLSGRVSAWCGRGTHFLCLWRLYIRDLARFANPDPPQYRYEPLKEEDHIRLLLLHPRFGFRPVSCTLIQGPAMRSLFYEAISYTWGAMKPTEEIMVDGCKLLVTKSVYEVLASYSSLILPKLLWIDAVCIDQNNIDEKALQVPLMQRIYRAADLTTVFLGRAPLADPVEQNHESLLPYRYDHLLPSSDQSWSHGHAVFDLFREFHVLENQLHGSGLRIYELYETVRRSRSTPREWTALQNLLQHPWFQRVWVVQEVALSDTVQVRYGGDALDWDSMAKAIKRLQRSREFRLWLEWEHGIQLRHMQYTNMYNIIRIDNMREKFHPREKYSRVELPTMAEILRESFFFSATNPRDQIYGLMALCESPSQVKVDYRARAEDTYVDAALELLSIGSIRTVLHAAGLGNQPEYKKSLPTWVPDWSAAPTNDMIGTHDKPWYTIPREERKNPRTPRFDVVDRQILRMSGQFVDTIHEMGPLIFETTTSESDGTMDEMLRLAKSWQNTQNMVLTSKRLDSVYAYDAVDQTTEEAFYRTMLVDKKRIDYASTTDKILPRLVHWEKALLGLSAAYSRNPTPSERAAIYDILLEMESVTELVESCCGGRRLFITRKGYIGLCPPYTMKGDVLYVVQNLDVALVLRKVTVMGPRRVDDDLDYDSRYYLVGEGYCHGVTNKVNPVINETRELDIV